MNASSLTLLRRIMLLLNVSIFVIICYVLAESTQVIINTGSSREFIHRLTFVPMAPSLVIFVSLLFFLLYIINTMLRRIVVKIQKVKSLYFFFCLLDIALCVALILVTSVNYRGILLLAMTHILYHTENKLQKVLLVGIFVLFYIVCQFELAAQYFPIVPLSTYVEYLDTSIRPLIYTLKNILFSCNDILFVMFMILWVQVQMDETSSVNKLYEQQYHTNQELKLVNIQLEHYISQSEETVKMRERNRLAREIHDTVGHSLTAISAGLDACKELLQVDINKLDKQLTALSGISKEVLLQVRRSVKHLRPDTLGELTLNEGILKLARDISNITNTEVHFACTGNGTLTPAQENVLYRTVQESITNSVKHGKATLVNIHLDISRHGALLTVLDNGTGCSHIIPGTGLLGLQERANEFNGSLEISGSGHFQTKLFLPTEENDS